MAYLHRREMKVYQKINQARATHKQMDCQQSLEAFIIPIDRIR